MMDKLKEWAKGKPIGLVIMAQQLAVGTGACFEFLRLIKAGEKIGVLSCTRKDKEWVWLYRSHRKMQRSLIEYLRRFGKNGRLAAEIGELVFLERRSLKKMVQELRKRYEKMSTGERGRFVSQAQTRANRLYNMHLGDIEGDIKGEMDEEFNRKFKEALNEPEIKFYLRVWIPCWLLYGEYPPRLLRRGRLGNLSAIEKLIRLDTGVLNDREIGKYLHKAREEGKKATVDRIAEALRRGPKPKIT